MLREILEQPETLKARTPQVPRFGGTEIKNAPAWDRGHDASAERLKPSTRDLIPVPMRGQK